MSQLQKAIRFQIYLAVLILYVAKQLALNNVIFVKHLDTEIRLN